MYNYCFDNEQTKFEKLNTIIEINNKEYIFNMLVTDKNILLFDNLNKNNILNTRGSSMPDNNELMLSIPLNNLKYKVEDNNTIINYNDINIIIYDFSLII